MIKNHFCFGFNGSEMIRYAIIFNMGALTVNDIEVTDHICR